MTRVFSRPQYDAVIIGARCAGAATALLLARAGARVLLVDREDGSQDTLSTHALTRPAVSLLNDWGLLRRITAGTPMVRQTRFQYGGDVVDVPVQPGGGVAGLYAPRRWLLDRVLRDAAWEAGVELHTGVTLAGVQKQLNGRVCGVSLRMKSGAIEPVSAGIVIGADGRQSSLAGMVGARSIMTSDTRAACIYSYVDGLANEGYRWYFGDRVSAGLIPTTDGAHCFFAACDPRAMRRWFNFDAFGGMVQMLSQWDPELAAELAARGPIERLRRYTGAPGHLRDCAGPGWALVGDAGYFKDPATAHGITDAFLDAQRLANALSAVPGEAGAYQAARDHLAPQMFTITQQIASYDWTLDQLKQLHMAFNACLKQEQGELSHSAISPMLAA
ncbi:FAD-dependent monooxygenase [Ruegeria sp. 2012CJ41-6]|uniref:FAD-dependent monooxygenase n=1 Tax=Ruegeria spongiae TaxID=2942209 RepID=A0ABT0Q6A2_9RHOB|nr:FAD-dependent monooxygenase [Ruegeria spongiae]MCL6284927.1 FAD-dependent monooxygenase [Ruegeria spongiae]